MNKKDKMTAYWVIGVVVLVLVIWGIYALSHKNAAPQTNNEQPAQQQNSAAPAPAPTTTNPAKPLSYGDAIKAYPNRFQFVGCQGTPASIAVKKGSPVMLDNRDKVSHTIKAAGQTFVLAGYHYAVLHPSAVGDSPVTCDGKNSVTLNVQK